MFCDFWNEIIKYWAGGHGHHSRIVKCNWYSPVLLCWFWVHIWKKSIVGIVKRGLKIPTRITEKQCHHIAMQIKSPSSPVRIQRWSLSYNATWNWAYKTLTCLGFLWLHFTIFFILHKFIIIFIRLSLIKHKI